MKKNFTLLFLFFAIIAQSQIKGIVKDVNGKPLPFVNIFEENTYNATTSNELGRFELNIKTPGKTRYYLSISGL